MINTTQSVKLNIKPVAAKVLKVLSKRNGAILASRHGINEGGKKRTLESIGQDHNITRERVRQIEEASYLKIRSSNEFELFEPSISKISDFLNENGGVVAEEHLMNSLVPNSQRPYLGLLLALSDEFIKIKESDEYNASWAVDKQNAKGAKLLLANTLKQMNNKKTTLSLDELFEVIQDLNESEEFSVEQSNSETLLNISKGIKQGPFGKWGLGEWAEISPRGVRDKVYLVMEREKNPHHFRELARLIDAGPFKPKSNRKTHPQTVHNELIKDDRFVLIGRGIYALATWGYMPGTVKDVIVSILKEKGNPLEKDLIVSRVMEQRKVQKNTILLNLQNRTQFKKTSDNKYYLA